MDGTSPITSYLGFKTPLLDRLWKGLWVTEPGCLEWRGHTTKKGYGLICLGGRHGKMRRVHKVFWEEYNGPVPAGLQLNHTCHNPPCVIHLYPGTHADNMRDMRERNRKAVLDGTPPVS